jgi:hypothetical protein
MPLQERYNPVWPLAGRMLDATREFVSLLTVTPTMNDPIHRKKFARLPRRFRR